MATPDELPPEARSDCFGPPAEPCECYCLHCQRVVSSADMWYQRVVNGPPGSTGFWMCPTPNCDGKGFAFDLHPVDPDHPANASWSSDDDDDESDDDDTGEDDDYDPDEPQYGGDLSDDDLEGEEWKLGLQPGERPVEAPEVAAAWAARAAEREAEQRKYDEPDRRPRTIDGSAWPRRAEPPPGQPLGEDDIPY